MNIQNNNDHKEIHKFNRSLDSIFLKFKNGYVKERAIKIEKKCLDLIKETLSKNPQTVKSALLVYRWGALTASLNLYSLASAWGMRILRDYIEDNKLLPITAQNRIITTVFQQYEQGSSNLTFAVFHNDLGYVKKKLLANVYTEKQMNSLLNSPACLNSSASIQDIETRYQILRLLIQKGANIDREVTHTLEEERLLLAERYQPLIQQGILTEINYLQRLQSLENEFKPKIGDPKLRLFFKEVLQVQKEIEDAIKVMMGERVNSDSYLYEFPLELLKKIQVIASYTLVVDWVLERINARPTLCTSTKMN